MGGGSETKVEPRAMRFLLGDDVHEITGLDPHTTLLNYLRGPVGRKGTKEGCAEGDCGACSVVLGELVDGTIRYRAVNSCIQLLPVLDGMQVLTVEDLADNREALHPVQQTMVERHGSQCGFCTPGFIMSLYAMYRSQENPGRAGIEDALAGNLCRCTGYGPIVDAAHEALSKSGKAIPADPATVEKLSLWRSDRADFSYRAQGFRFDAPRSIDSLTTLLAQNPQACLIAGLTDVGLWVTKQHRRLDHIVSLARIEELTLIEEGPYGFHIGAAVCYSDLADLLARRYPDFGELIRRLGSRQIRNVGTMGGNIANGSPIGDSPPALIALGAMLTLTSAQGKREIPIEDFFIDYGQQDLRAGEFLEKIFLPHAPDRNQFRCYKISKRFDQDISALCGAFNLRLDCRRVEDIRIAFGGMAAIPKRAARAEGRLRGQDWTEANVRAAMAALAEDFTPMTDHRASARYRLLAAQNLILKFYLETAQTGAAATRILESRGPAYG